MQRKQLEKHYDVKIYQEPGCYILEENGTKEAFRYMSEIKEYLGRRDKEKEPQVFALYRNDELLTIGTRQELAEYLGVTKVTISGHLFRTRKNKNKTGYKVYEIKEDDE